MHGVDDLSINEAEQIIESLRAGLPAVGYLQQFTVGREDEVKRLENTLHEGDDDLGTALLVQANYGAGKSHLLQLIREMALDAGFAVSLVTVDAKGGVRFNRMDQVVGAITRSLNFEQGSTPGVGALFNAFESASLTSVSGADFKLYHRITARDRWDSSQALRSPAMWVALRAWIRTEKDSTRELIADWLSYPHNYRSNRTQLYKGLVADVPHIREPRSERSFYQSKILVFGTSGDYEQSWGALDDLNSLCRLSGRRGLIILFDEFEDVIQNLNNINYERSAFANLFDLFNGERFRGKSYFAVTPEFAAKCRDHLYQKQVYGFPVERFEELERYEVEPVERDDFLTLARRIRGTHGIAYEWDSTRALPDTHLDQHVEEFYSSQSVDQVRQAVTATVRVLDDLLA